jgi:membrane-associated protease RseP (regulator of RpoE activity)
MEETNRRKTQVIQLTLFFVTLCTTTLAGAEWMYGKYVFYGEELLSYSEILSGLYFSIPFLGILTVHEFGHYFTSRYYNIKVTLPFYIPMWLGFLSIPFTIGTMGAFIRIKEIIHSRKEYFDVGIAGPLAGFVMALMVLTYGFTHLPEPEFIFEIHPEYREYGMDYEKHIYDQLPANLAIGDNLLFLFFKNYVADPEKVPNQYELYHYPWLFAGFLALFFTAINLLPIGQLDGGHVIYGLFGYKHSRIISRVLFLILITISGIGWVPQGPLNIDFFISLVFYLLFLFLAFFHFEKDIKKRILLVIWVIIIQVFSTKYFPLAADYGIYMAFAFLLGRFLGIDHPKAIIDKPLDLKRKIIGWIALGVFIVSFTPRPLYFEFNEKTRIEQPGFEKEDRAPSPSKVITRRVIEIF